MKLVYRHFKHEGKSVLEICVSFVRSLNYRSLNYRSLQLRYSLFSITVQQDVTMYTLLYFCNLLCMFRMVTPSISSSSTYNCNCSIWHWSNFGKCSVWSQLKMTGMCSSLLYSAIAESSRDGYIPLIFSWSHTLHFPKFYQCQMLQLQLYVLLMMGGVTTRNM